MRVSTLYPCLVAGSLICGPALAAPPHAKPPAGAPTAEAARIETRAHNKTDFGTGTRIEGTRTYVAGKRGSLAVGLLLGPIGVAGNAAHVAEGNRKRGETLGALTQVDLVASLRTIRDTAGTPEAAAGAAAYDLLPSLHLRFDSDTSFHVGCQIIATLPQVGKRAWRVRYAVELPGDYDSQSQESIDAAARNITLCLTEANRLFTTHIAGGMLPGPVMPAAMLGKAQKQPFVAEEYPTKLIVPDAAGLVEYAPSEIK